MNSAAMRRLAAALMLLTLALIMGGCWATLAHADDKALPLSPFSNYPARCAVPYDLAPGARAVMLCAVRAPRGSTLEGIAQIESGHEAVDVSLVYSLHATRHVFRVTNTSTTTAARGTAQGRVW